MKGYKAVNAEKDFAELCKEFCSLMGYREEKGYLLVGYKEKEKIPRMLKRVKK